MAETSAAVAAQAAVDGAQAPVDGAQAPADGALAAVDTAPAAVGAPHETPAPSATLPRATDASQSVEGLFNACHFVQLFEILM